MSRPDLMKCVWMTAGVLSYKLCGRGFDYDHCPLDAALQGRGMRPVLGAAGGRPAPWEFRTDRRYHPSHGWVKRIGGPRVRYGLDAFAGRLLDQTTAVILPRVPSRMDRGLTACWIMDEDELIPLRAPVSGTVYEVNGRVREEPGLIHSSPYDEGWLMDLVCDEPLSLTTGLVDAAEQRERAGLDLKRMHACIPAEREDPYVGPTLEDGGEPTLEVRRLLERDRFLRLLVDFLG